MVEDLEKENKVGKPFSKISDLPAFFVSGMVQSRRKRKGWETVVFFGLRECSVFMRIMS